MSLNSFEIIRKLGEGAFSCVYKVNRKLDGQCYALKKVKLGTLSIKEKENALNEIRILASFCHNNIIAYKDSFIDEKSNTLCIVMELAEGGDLMKRINEHKKLGSNFSEYEIWSALVHIANGLKVLHNANIIHRDLKCANIFISKDGVYKLGDLNISKVNKLGLAYTQTGTPYYASPEVWRDEPYNYSSDIWSLGCVIYEMAALDPPFVASDIQVLYKKIIKGDYHEIPHIYSESLVRVIRQLLQVNPNLRPNCEQILNLPTVKRYASFSLNKDPKDYESPELLKTIKFEPCIQNLKTKLPTPNYENRGISANYKIPVSLSNRDINTRGQELCRNRSLNSRESPKMPILRQISLEALERNNRHKNLLRLDGDIPDILNKYPVLKPPIISPEKYAKKIEDIVNRKFPDSAIKPLNKIGMMIIETPKPPLRIPPLIQSPLLMPMFKEPALHG